MMDEDQKFGLVWVRKIECDQQWVLRKKVFFLWNRHVYASYVYDLQVFDDDEILARFCDNCLIVANS